MTTMPSSHLAAMHGGEEVTYLMGALKGYSVDADMDIVFRMLQSSSNKKRREKDFGACKDIVNILLTSWRGVRVYFAQLHSAASSYYNYTSYVGQLGVRGGR